MRPLGARRQYDAVDPDNRLVAAELEQRWNERLLADLPPKKWTGLGRQLLGESWAEITQSRV